MHFSARQDVYADQLLADISGKIGNQEFESAEALLAKARSLLPRTILDILAARLLFARGAHDEAKRALTIATQRHPKDAALWAALGGLQAQTGAFSEAVNSLSQSVQIDPSNPVNWDLLAAALQRINFQMRAIEACGFALKVKPDFLPSVVRLSQIYLHLKDWKKTIEFARKALLINPASGDALFNLGIALIEMRKHDEAAECFEKLSDLSEQDEEAKINLGNALLGGDKIAKAIAIYERVVERKPDWSGGFHNLGNAYSNNSEWDKARAAYENAYKLDPNNTEVLFSLGCLQLHLGDFRSGFSHYEHRNKSRDRIQKRFENIPVWSGEPLTGKRVVVFGEQGLGDNIQIIRYVRELFRAGAARLVDVDGDGRLEVGSGEVVTLQSTGHREQIGHAGGQRRARLHTPAVHQGPARRQRSADQHGAMIGSPLLAQRKHGTAPSPTPRPAGSDGTQAPSSRRLRWVPWPGPRCGGR